MIAGVAALMNDVVEPEPGPVFAPDPIQAESLCCPLVLGPELTRESAETDRFVVDFPPPTVARVERGCAGGEPIGVIDRDCR